MANKEFGTLHYKNVYWRFCCSIHALYKDLHVHSLPDYLFLTKVKAIHKVRQSLQAIYPTQQSAFELFVPIFELLQKPIPYYTTYKELPIMITTNMLTKRSFTLKYI